MQAMQVMRDCSARFLAERARLPAERQRLCRWHWGEGTNWRTQASGTRNELDSVCFTPDGQYGWAAGFGGTIVATSHGGKTWMHKASGTENAMLAMALTANGQHGWTVDFDGTILTFSTG